MFLIRAVGLCDAVQHKVLFQMLAGGEALFFVADWSSSGRMRLGEGFSTEEGAAREKSHAL